MDSGGCGRGRVCDCHLEVPSTVNQESSSQRQTNNQRLALKLGLVALFFVGFGFALVPIYDAFCRITGLNGRTNDVAAVVDKNTQIDRSRTVKVEFLSHSMPGVMLDFKPDQFDMKVHPGEVAHTTYTVHNRSNKVFVGQAVPSVTPAVLANDFQKIECFCFTQQTFQPGEKRTMPVVFVVSPDMERDYGTITLSYTFFEAVKPDVAKAKI
jgi:cytochrome c oxidase assembly protein subunit 11